MAEPEWGLKRLCPGCNTRFYDLTKDPTTCPSCGESYALDALSERKSHGTTRSRAKPSAPKAAPTIVDDDDIIDDDSDDNDTTTADQLLDDAEDDDDDDDLGEITPERKGGDEDEA
jgi:uncharacterized protein (TIGR02300 family)